MPQLTAFSMTSLGHCRMIQEKDPYIPYMSSILRDVCLCTCASLHPCTPVRMGQTSMYSCIQTWSLYSLMHMCSMFLRGQIMRCLQVMVCDDVQQSVDCEVLKKFSLTLKPCARSCSGAAHAAMLPRTSRQPTAGCSRRRGRWGNDFWFQATGSLSGNTIFNLCCQIGRPSAKVQD